MCPVGAELFYADGQTDMTKLIVAFRIFMKASKKNPPPSTVTKAPKSPLAFSKHPLRIQGRAAIILSKVVRDLPQTPYSTFKYLITVFFLAPFKFTKPHHSAYYSKHNNRCSRYVIRQPAPQQVQGYS